ncbi:hypothetical protein COL23_25620 [Priestia aryabhattai]|uniref:methyl-accepting chemotaxis protein n=1 Tax=Priestia aryabhattai TaxID=412384 RepID=UPI000BF58B29|nr:methyl-accepting chemotaxis protein [Priestia aryabhattai]PFW72132.1 hypothetical protein COL23_25620 [Priestia aryabhattai]
MTELEIIQKRNSQMIKVAWLLVGMDALFNLIAKTELTRFLLVILISAIILGLLQLLHHKNVGTKFIMYLFSFLFVTVVFFIAVTADDPNRILVDALFLFLPPFFASLYQHLLNICLTTSASALAFAYIAHKHGADIFPPGFHYTFFLILVFLLFGVVSAVTARFGENLRKQTRQQANELFEQKKELENVYESLRAGSETINQFSHNLNNDMDRNNQRSEEIYTSFEEMLSALDTLLKSIYETSGNVTEVSEQLQQIDRSSRKMKSIILQSTEKVSEANGEMNTLYRAIDTVGHTAEENVTVNEELMTAFSEIEGIIQLIQGVANQTNLLALNASIEAARAGDQGKGFKVVADEVKALAQQSSDSVNRISSILHSLKEKASKTNVASKRSQEQIQESLQTVKSLQHTFEDIENNSEEVVSHTEEVADMIKDVSNVAENIAENMVHVSAISVENQSGLAELSTSLNLLLENFADIAKNVDRLRRESDDLFTQH